MNVSNICRREVQLAQQDESVLVAAARMRQHNVGTLVVLDKARKPVGILTDRDLALRVLGEGRDPARTRVVDVMTSHPQTLTPETSLERALASMRALGVRRMPVTGTQGELLGLVSVDDFFTQLASTLGDLSQVFGHSAAGLAPPALVPVRRERASAGLERANSDPQC